MDPCLFDGERVGHHPSPWWSEPHTLVEIALYEQGDPDARILLHDVLAFKKAAEEIRDN